MACSGYLTSSWTSFHERGSKDTKWVQQMPKKMKWVCNCLSQFIILLKRENEIDSFSRSGSEPQWISRVTGRERRKERVPIWLPLWNQGWSFVLLYSLPSSTDPGRKERKGISSTILTFGEWILQIGLSNIWSLRMVRRRERERNRE